MSDEGGILVIAEEDIGVVGLGSMTLEEYVDLILSVVESSVLGFELVSREQIETEQGLPAEVVAYSFQEGLLFARRFIYLHEDTVGFNATYVSGQDRIEELEPIINHSFSTFQVTEP